MPRMAKPQTVASNKYNAKAYDSLRIVVKKGQKDVIQAHAAAMGESINGFVNRAISEQMQRDQEAASAGEVQ
ncbi:MAG TPA: hypothetical protein H9915_02965 [Candidatus Gemmiger faecigallinarum]|nr:hypothetical protein [Candidatus Gemmiger faecigallinarum]